MGTSGLGALLVDEGLLTESDRRMIRRTCGSHGSAFARSVIAMGLVDEDELSAFLAEKTHWRVAPKNLTAHCQPTALAAIDRPLLERLEVLPVRIDGQSLIVAMIDPLDQDTLKQLAFFTGYKILPIIATLSEIRAGLSKFLKNYRPASSHLEDFLANHAPSASRRLKLQEKWAERGVSGAAAGKTKKAAPASLAEAPSEEEIRASPSQPEENSGEADLDYPDAVNAAEGPKASSAPESGARAKAPEASAEGDLLEAGDDAFSTEDGDLASLDEGGVASGAPLAPPAAGSDVLDDILGDDTPTASAENATAPDFDDAGSLDELGDSFGLDAPTAAPEAESKTPAPQAKQAPPATVVEGGELEDEIDLSSLDPDLDSDSQGGDSDDLSDDDFGLAPSSPAPKATAPVPKTATPAAKAAVSAKKVPPAADSGASTLDDILGIDAGTASKSASDVSGAEDLDSLLDDAAIAEGGSASLEASFDDPGIDDEGTLEVSEDIDSAESVESAESLDRGNGGDAPDSSDASELGADLLPGARAAVGEPDLALEGEANPFEVDELAEASADLGLEPASEPSIEEDFGAAGLDGTEEIADAGPQFDSDAADAESGDGALLAARASELNQALMAVTMSADAAAGAAKAAPALARAGLERGVVFAIEGATVRPLVAWESEAKGDPRVVNAPSGLSGYVTKGLAAALARFQDDWSSVDAATRAVDLRPFQAWTAKGSVLKAIRCPAKSQGQSLAIVAAFAPDVAEVAEVAQLAAVVTRALAKKR